MDSPKQRLAIVGAGPIGLEAALYARRLGVTVAVYERGRVADFAQQWGHVRLFSPFGMNITPLGRAAIVEEFPGHRFPADNEYITGREHFASYLEPLAKTQSLKDAIHTETQVLHLARQSLLKEDMPGSSKRSAYPFRLLLREKGKERVAEADVVLDCSGTYGTHRWLGDGGIPAPGELAAEAQTRYTLDDILHEKKPVYAGKSVLVVGGGYSAATSVCSLAALSDQHPEMSVVWLARTQGTQPIKRIMNDPLRERDRLAVQANMLATRGDGNVQFHPHSVVRSVEYLGPDRGFRVCAQLARGERTWEVDRLVANVGYTPDTTIYRELQVHECYASCGPMRLAAALAGDAGKDCLQQVSHGPDSLRNPEPNFYILGAKSYGRNSHFLLRIGFDQVRDVFTLISGDPKLNLYR